MPIYYKNQKTAKACKKGSASHTICQCKMKLIKVVLYIDKFYSQQNPSTLYLHTGVGIQTLEHSVGPIFSAPDGQMVCPVHSLPYQ